MLAKMSLCSAEEDCGSLDVEDRDGLHSPTDVSEDSVEVRVTPIAGKRKLGPPPPQPAQPAGGPDGDVSQSKRTALPPSPKRRRASSPLSPFRPWSAPSPAPSRPLIPAPASDLARLAPYAGLQEEPLALVKTRVSTATPTVPVIPCNPRSQRGPRSSGASRAAQSRLPPATPSSTTTSNAAASRFSVESIIGDVVSRTNQQPACTATRDAVEEDADADHSALGARAVGPGQQRNYKNMTRERRIEANARERTRVHTISAAFATLRRAVPAYSHSQKLSKLSVLRIACSYILTLSRVAGMDYSADQSQPPLQECVDLVTRTIQNEGKLRRKRDE